MRFLPVGHLDAPGKARVAIAGFEHPGIYDPQFRHVGLQRSIMRLVPLCYDLPCQPARLAPTYSGPNINIKVDAVLSAHRDDPAVLIQVHHQLACENRNSFVILTVTMPRAATGFGFFTNRQHLLPRAREPEHRPEVFDGCHAGNIGAGYLVYRRHHEWRLRLRADQVDRTRAWVNFYTNVLCLEFGNLCANVTRDGSFGFE